MTLEIDLSMRYDHWLKRGQVIERLEVEVDGLEVLSKGQDEVISRMS